MWFSPLGLEAPNIKFGSTPVPQDFHVRSILFYKFTAAHRETILHHYIDSVATSFLSSTEGTKKERRARVTGIHRRTANTTAGVPWWPSRSFWAADNPPIPSGIDIGVGFEAVGSRYGRSNNGLNTIIVWGWTWSGFTFSHRGKRGMFMVDGFAVIVPVCVVEHVNIMERKSVKRIMDCHCQGAIIILIFVFP